jgi:hypothetical protein
MKKCHFPFQLAYDVVLSVRLVSRCTLTAKIWQDLADLETYKTRNTAEKWSTSGDQLELLNELLLHN